LPTSRALVSYRRIATDQVFRCDHLKLCCLWYDEVLFETLGQYHQARLFEGLLGNEEDGAKAIKELTDIILPLDSRVSPEVIEDTLDASRPGYPRWGNKYQNYTYPNPESAEQYAHNRLLQSIADEKGVARFNDGFEIELVEGRARIAVDAVRLWQRVNTEVECMFQATEDERLAMLAAQEFSSMDKQPPAPFSLFQMEVPSLSSVSWRQIVRLRQSSGINSLREKIAKAVQQSATDLVAAKQIFDTLEKHTIDEIVEAAKPKPAKVAIESIFTNIPIPLVNPFGIAASVRDTFRAVKEQKELSWLYLLRDIRRAAESPENHS